jgi:hypothetical protein
MKCALVRELTLDKYIQFADGCQNLSKYFKGVSNKKLREKNNITSAIV